jgi:hypothetical protein
MTGRILRHSLVAIALALPAAAFAQPAAPSRPIGNPVLHLIGTEFYTAGGKDFVRYRYDIFNKDQFPAELFAPAPALPPCGANANSSRTWLDFYDQRGKRLYGFCALAKPEDLGSIWFALEEGVVPPSWIYVELTDRQTNKKYKSNLAETEL